MEPSCMPLSSSDELTGLFLGAVASPQSRPPLHPVHSNYNGPIQQRSVPESDTTFLLLPPRRLWRRKLERSWNEDRIRIRPVTNRSRLARRAIRCNVTLRIQKAES